MFTPIPTSGAAAGAPAGGLSQAAHTNADDTGARTGRVRPEASSWPAVAPRARSPGHGWRALVAAGMLLGAAAGAAFAQTGTATAPSQASIEKAVIEVLKARPELVRDAISRLEQRDAAARARSERKALAQSGKELMSSSGATVLGNPGGDVTLVEFVDYRCGYCKTLSTSIDTLLQRDKQLRVLVKHLPILGPDSVAAASLMLSAGKDTDLPRLHRALMGATQLDPTALQAIAQHQAAGAAKAGSDAAAAQKQLADVAALAERLGIQGTPAIVVGDQVFRGALDVAQLEAAVQAARRQSKPKAVAGL